MMRLINLLFRMPPFASTIIVGTAIAWLTLAPHPLPDDERMHIPGADKVVHAVMFGALMGAMAFDVWRRGDSASGIPIPESQGKTGDDAWAFLGFGTVAVLFIICVVAGGLIELAQESMGLGRTASAADWLADAVGALAAALCARPAISWMVRHRRP